MDGVLGSPEAEEAVVLCVRDDLEDEYDPKGTVAPHRVKGPPGARQVYLVEVRQATHARFPAVNSRSWDPPEAEERADLGVVP